VSRGALGSGLAIFTKFPLISAQALPYSLSGSPAQAIEGDFFVKKAAANVTVLHPLLGEVEIWTSHVGSKERKGGRLEGAMLIGVDACCGGAPTGYETGTSDITELAAWK
jgi:hypothetical protein